MARLVATRHEGVQTFYRLENDHVAQLSPTPSTMPSTPDPASPVTTATPQLWPRCTTVTRPADGRPPRPRPRPLPRLRPQGRAAGHLRPHNHHAADSIDGALEASSAGNRAVRTSPIVLGLTALLQVVVVAISRSVALLADTIHDFSDALTAVPLWIAFALSCRAATERFTYGYGRAEDSSGLFVLAMVARSAVAAGYEAIWRLLDPQPIENGTALKPDGRPISSDDHDGRCTTAEAGTRFDHDSRRWQ